MTDQIVRRFDEETAGIGDIPGSRDLEPGRINWLHGVKQGKMPGIFYVKDTEVTDVPGAPWEFDDSRFDEEKGYSAATLRIAFLGSRSQWFIPGEKKGDLTTWLPDYQAGAKKLTEHLVFAEGIPDVMVLSVSGMHKSKPITELLRSYWNGLLRQASRKVKRQLPPWSFWLPIANKRQDGKTHYIEAEDADGQSYGSVVTPPALYLPEDALNECWAGMDFIRMASEVRQQYVLWFEYKRETRSRDEPRAALPAPAPQLALPPGRNVPQPIDEADLPF